MFNAEKDFLRLISIFNIQVHLNKLECHEKVHLFQ